MTDHLDQENDMTSPTQRRHDELVALLTEIRDRLPEPEGVNAVEPAPADDGLAEWERELLRPTTCCGKCPPIAGGGYDCTCEGNPHCEKADTPEEWHAEPAPDAVDPDEELAVIIEELVDDHGSTSEWADNEYITRSTALALARAAREHIEADVERLTRERDEWQARHAALRADVEEMRREVWRGLWPDFRGVLARDTERGDVDPDAVTISLPRDDLTKPTVLRLAAADLRRKYHLGMGGLPRSLPGTLDALADALDLDTERAES